MGLVLFLRILYINGEQIRCGAYMTITKKGILLQKDENKIQQNKTKQNKKKKKKERKKRKEKERKRKRQDKTRQDKTRQDKTRKERKALTCCCCWCYFYCFCLFLLCCFRCCCFLIWCLSQHFAVQKTAFQELIHFGPLFFFSSTGILELPKARACISMAAFVSYSAGEKSRQWSPTNWLHI